MIFAPLALVLMFVIGGVFGAVILRAALRRSVPPTEGKEDRRIEDLESGYHQLEARFERLEEEVTFFRDLYSPDQPARLPLPDDGDRV